MCVAAKSDFLFIISEAGRAPQNGDDIVFAGWWGSSENGELISGHVGAGEHTTTNMNIQDLWVESLTWNGDSRESLHDLTGLALGVRTYIGATPKITISNEIYGAPGCENLTIQGSYLRMEGDITGSQSMTIRGDSVFLGGTNTFAGDLTITGTLSVGGGNAIPDAADVTINGFGKLNISTNEASESIGRLFGTGEVRLSYLDSQSGGELTVLNGGDFSGDMTGRGSLDMRGAATLTLSGNIDLEEGVTVSSGTLVSSIASLQSPVINNAQLILNENADVQWDGGFTGTGTFIKAGAGTLTLTSPVAYTGDTRIDEGAIRLGVDDALAGTEAVTIGAAALLDLGTCGTSVGGIAGEGAIKMDRGVLTVDESGTRIWDGTLIGSGSLVKTGAGCVIMTGKQSYTGPAHVEQGTLILNADNALQADNQVEVGAGAALGLSNQTLSGITGQGAVSLGGTLAIQGTGDLTLSPTLAGAGSLELVGPGTLALTGANSYTGSTTIRGGKLLINSDAALGAAPASTVDHQLVLAGGVLGVNANTTLAPTRGVRLDALRSEMNVDLMTKLRIDGPVAGMGNLVKNGQGGIILAGPGAWAGQTRIEQGRLETAAPEAIPDTSAVDIADVAGASLRLGANETIGSLSGAGAVYIDAYTLTVGTNDADTTFTGDISGTGSLVKTGRGTMTLVGNLGTAPYSGGTTVDEGTLKGTTSSLRGDIAVNAALEFEQASGFAAYDGAVSGTGRLIKSGSGKLMLTGTNSYSGDTVIQAGTLEAWSGNAIGDLSAVNMESHTTTLSLYQDETIGSLSGDGTVWLDYGDLTLGGNDQSTTFSGWISGDNKLIKKGQGTLTLTYNYSHGYEGLGILGGTLSVTKSSALGNTDGDITISGGALRLTNTVSTVNIAHDVIVGSGGGQIDLANSPALGGSTTLSGLLSGGGNLAKTGMGLLTIAGTAANTYSGMLTINQGTVKLDKPDNTTALVGDVVLDGGTLQVSADGQIGGASTLRINSGSINLGGHTLSMGAVQLADNADLSTRGTLGGRFSGSAGSSITSLGELTLGDSSSYLGFRHGGLLDIGWNSATLNSRGFAQLGSLTMIQGGMLDAPNGLVLGSGCALVGSGNVNAKIAAEHGSTIEIDEGNFMMLGDMEAVDGFYSEGTLIVGGNLNIWDANEAVLGSLTQIGSSTSGSHLYAPNGLNLRAGRNLVGHGSVEGDIVMDGYVRGEGDDPMYNAIEFLDEVSGYGTFAGNVIFSGGFSPGHSCADVELENVTFGPASVLLMEIGGTSPGTEYDQLLISGNATLGGELQIALIDGYIPSPEDIFALLNWNTSAGSFDVVTLPQVGLDMDWDTSQLASGGRLSIRAIPEPGTAWQLLLIVTLILRSKVKRFR